MLVKPRQLAQVPIFLSIATDGLNKRHRWRDPPRPASPANPPHSTGSPGATADSRLHEAWLRPSVSPNTGLPRTLVMLLQPGCRKHSCRAMARPRTLFLTTVKRPRWVL